MLGVNIQCLVYGLGLQYVFVTHFIIVHLPVQEERDKVKEDFKDFKRSDANDLMKSLPRDMLFVMRSTNIVRPLLAASNPYSSLHSLQLLGAPASAPAQAHNSGDRC